MVKTLIAVAVAGAFALPMAAQASGSNNIVLAQGGGGDTGASTRQPGATPPGQISPGTPRSAATSEDRETGADRHANPSGGMGRDRSASGRSASGNFDRLDKNHDGYISRDEAQNASELDTRFTELDRNNDGKLSRDEYNALNSSSRGATGTGRSGSMGSGSSMGSSSTAPTGKGPGAQESATRPLGGGDGGSK